MQEQTTGPALKAEQLEKQLGEQLEELPEGLTGLHHKLFVAVAVSWAIFQLSLASILILDSMATRCIHLAFALVLAYLVLPWKKKAGVKKKATVLDYLFALIGAFTALYLFLDFEALALRAGRPITRDLILGLLLIFFVLDAARRSIGPALPIIALLFSMYAFLGPYMPNFIAFRGVSLNKYLHQISLSSEGIFGIPLDVSASTIYLFVLFGAMLEKAGAGRFFTDLALSVLGHYKGGPAKAAVVSSGLSGLVSGSSIANIVTTGTFTIPLMKKAGLPAHKAAATEVAASTDGQLMPPIMGAAAFIIAEYVNVPYIEVVKAAIIPAFVSYFALFYLTHLEAGKLNIRAMDKSETPDFKSVFLGGFHHLIPLGMLFFELVVMLHSPKLAVFRSILVLMVILFFQEGKKANWQLLPSFKGWVSVVLSGFQQGSKNMIPVALATAAAGIIVGVVGMGLGGMVNSIVESLAQGNLILLLLITAFASLILGMGLPTTATYIVMASLTAPVIVYVGASYQMMIPLMAAHLFCFYFGILADDTPPVGLASYAAAAIAESDPIQTGLQGFFYDLRTAIIPFMFVLNPELILHGVNSWLDGFLIFGMAVLGAFAFTSALHRWMFIKNRLYESLLLFGASLLLFYPRILGDDMKIEGYLAGLVVYAMVILLQKARVAKQSSEAVTPEG